MPTAEFVLDPQVKRALDAGLAAAFGVAPTH